MVSVVGCVPIPGVANGINPTITNASGLNPTSGAGCIYR